MASEEPYGPCPRCGAAMPESVADWWMARDMHAYCSEQCASGQPPALAVAAVTEDFAETVGELADAAQAMAIDEHGTLRPVTDFTEHPEPGRPHKWWCDGDDATGPHVHCWDHVHAVDLLTGKSAENGGRGVADAAQEAARADQL